MATDRYARDRDLHNRGDASLYGAPGPALACRISGGSAKRNCGQRSRPRHGDIFGNADLNSFLASADVKMIMAHCFAVQLRFVARKPREEALFALGAVIEQAAGRFAPEPWWRRD